MNKKHHCEAEYAAEEAVKITIELSGLMAATSAICVAMDEGTIGRDEVELSLLHQVQQRLYCDLLNHFETLRQYVGRGSILPNPPPQPPRSGVPV